MNCPKCNKPLEANSLFCPNCGEPISRTPVNHPTANPIPPYQPASMGEPPTLPPDRQKNEPLILQPGYQQGPQVQNQGAAQHWPQPQQSPYVQSANAATGINTNASTGETKPRRRGQGCLVGSLITLVVLVVLLGGGWFLVLRPYLNNMVSNKLDSILTDSANKIPPQVALAPGGRVTIPEKVLNILLVLEIFS